MKKLVLTSPIFGMLAVRSVDAVFVSAAFDPPDRLPGESIEPGQESPMPAVFRSGRNAPNGGVREALTMSFDGIKN